MKINSYFIQLAIAMLMIFGGTFIIRYFRTDEILLDQIMGASVGFLLLFASLIWRKTNKQT